MLVSVPPTNLPLIRLPFFNSKESALAVIAVIATTHRATIAPQIFFVFITSSPVHSLADRVRSGSCQVLSSSESECLSAPCRRKVLQQFLRSLIEPFLVFLLFFAGFNRMLGSTYPNELLYGGVIHTNDESPDVTA